MPYTDEETPLLRSSRSSSYASQMIRPDTHDMHIHFRLLAGVPPSNLPQDARRPAIARRSLYGRAVHSRNAQDRTYLITASLSNTLFLSQVVLGAALTGAHQVHRTFSSRSLARSTSSSPASWPTRNLAASRCARRMFRDDHDRVVDEIENSEVMWLGIQNGVHGYDEIAIDDSISVRSEVARFDEVV